MSKIKAEGYISFVKNTKPGQMIIEDVLETGTTTLIHSGPGVGKTGLGFDMAASILTKRDWLGHFKVQTDNAYIFFISQDAPRQDVLQQSWKVFRRYFDPRNAADTILLQSRFFILDHCDIKLDRPGEVDGSALAGVLNTTIEASKEKARLSETLRAIGATGADWAERLAEHQAEVEIEKQVEKYLDVDEEKDVAPGEEMTAPAVQPVVLPDPVVILIWDVMRRFHNGKESQSDELAPFFDGVEKVHATLRAAGVKVSSIIFHHDNRGGDYKGDTTVLGSVDVAYQLVPAKGSDATAPQRDIHLKITKPRGIQCRPFTYRQIRDGIKTNAESLQYQWLKPTESDVAPSRSRRADKASPIPVEKMARQLYKPGMSGKALGRALRGAGFKLAKAKEAELLQTCKEIAMMKTGLTELTQ